MFHFTALDTVISMQVVVGNCQLLKYEKVTQWLGGSADRRLESPDLEDMRLQAEHTERSWEQESWECSLILNPLILLSLIVHWRVIHFWIFKYVKSVGFAYRVRVCHRVLCLKLCAAIIKHKRHDPISFVFLSLKNCAVHFLTSIVIISCLISRQLLQAGKTSYVWCWCMVLEGRRETGVEKLRVGLAS